MTAPGSTIQRQDSAQQSLQASKKNCIHSHCHHTRLCLPSYIHSPLLHLRVNAMPFCCGTSAWMFLSSHYQPQCCSACPQRPLLLQLAGCLRLDPLAPQLLLAREHELLFSHLRNGGTHLWPIQQRPAHQMHNGVHIRVIQWALEHCPPPFHRGCGGLLVPAAEHLKVIVFQG